VLRERYDRQAFKAQEIYPDIWDESAEELLDGYLLTYFEDLKTFILAAAADGKALITYIC
jgi:hypothetical protein